MSRLGGKGYALRLITTHYVAPRRLTTDFCVQRHMLVSLEQARRRTSLNGVLAFVLVDMCGHHIQCSFHVFVIVDHPVHGPNTEHQHQTNSMVNKQTRMVMYCRKP